MTTPKYNRKVRVEFTGVTIPPVTDLRVAFEIDKNDGQQFNHAMLTIWNMNASNRAKIARPMPLDTSLRFEIKEPVLGVKLFAGYEGESVHLFSGDVLWAQTIQDGPDWIVRMELYTGLAAATGATAQVSFAKKTPAKTVVDGLLKPLGFTIRYTAEAEKILNGQQIEDFTTSGLSHREADEFLKRYNLAFTIEEEGQGLVYVPTRPREADRQKNSTNTFSPENGLVGTPSISRSGVSIKSLLRPQIRIFDKFFVQSQTTQGTLQNTDYAAEYYAIQITHIGDTRGADWHTEIEGAYTLLGEL